MTEFRRHIPGPAGLLLEEIGVADDLHAAVLQSKQKIPPIVDVPLKRIFWKGPWLTAMSQCKVRIEQDSENKKKVVMQPETPDTFLCNLHSVKANCYRKRIESPLIFVIEDINFDSEDPSFVAIDPWGKLEGSIHRKCLRERREEIDVGAVMIVKNVNPYCPTPDEFYLNIVSDNVILVHPRATPIPEEYRVVIQMADKNYLVSRQRRSSSNSTGKRRSDVSVPSPKRSKPNPKEEELLLPSVFAPEPKPCTWAEGDDNMMEIEEEKGFQKNNSYPKSAKKNKFGARSKPPKPKPPKPKFSQVRKSQNKFAVKSSQNKFQVPEKLSQQIFSQKRMSQNKFQVSQLVSQNAFQKRQQSSQNKFQVSQKLSQHISQKRSSGSNRFSSQNKFSSGRAKKVWKLPDEEDESDDLDDF